MSQQQKSLVDLLKELFLGSDPDQQQQFGADPQGYLAQNGFPDATGADLRGALAGLTETPQALPSEAAGRLGDLMAAPLPARLAAPQPGESDLSAAAREVSYYVTNVSGTVMIDDHSVRDDHSSTDDHSTTDNSISVSDDSTTVTAGGNADLSTHTDTTTTTTTTTEQAPPTSGIAASIGSRVPVAPPPEPVVVGPPTGVRDHGLPESATHLVPDAMAHVPATPATPTNTPPHGPFPDVPPGTPAIFTPPHGPPSAAVVAENVFGSMIGIPPGTFHDTGPEPASPGPGGTAPGVEPDAGTMHAHEDPDSGGTVPGVEPDAGTMNVPEDLAVQQTPPDDDPDGS